MWPLCLFYLCLLKTVVQQSPAQSWQTARAPREVKRGPAPTEGALWGRMEPASVPPVSTHPPPADRTGTSSTISPIVPLILEKRLQDDSFCCRVLGLVSRWQTGSWQIKVSFTSKLRSSLTALATVTSVLMTDYIIILNSEFIAEFTIRPWAFQLQSHLKFNPLGKHSPDEQLSEH